MTGDSGRTAWLRQARSSLHPADPVLARLIDDRPDFDPRAWMTQLPVLRRLRAGEAPPTAALTKTTSRKVDHDDQP